MNEMMNLNCLWLEISLCFVSINTTFCISKRNFRRRINVVRKTKRKSKHTKKAPFFYWPVFLYWYTVGQYISFKEILNRTKSKKIATKNKKNKKTCSLLSQQCINTLQRQWSIYFFRVIWYSFLMGTSDFTNIWFER